MGDRLPAPGNCRSCGAPVLWVRTERGKLMPLDVFPSDAGNVSIDTPDQRATVLTGLFLENARRGHATLYKSHFASCPKADEHRQPGFVESTT